MGVVHTFNPVLGRQGQVGLGVPKSTRATYVLRLGFKTKK